MRARKDVASSRVTAATLKTVLQGKLVLVGVGNILRGDDGFGPALIAKIRAKTTVRCIDAGTTPENYVGRIAREKPDSVVIIDAAHLDTAPGECRLLERDEILTSGFTTHDMSPGLFLDYLAQETGAAIHMLAVQPERLTLGEEMSPLLEKRLDELHGLLLEVLPRPEG